MNTRFIISHLGEAKQTSPLKLANRKGTSLAKYITNDERIIHNISLSTMDTINFSNENTIEKAGPREFIYFKPNEVHAGILTCGGLCPGLNDVIRSIVRTLWHTYGVTKITGIRYGYNGLLDQYENPYKELTPKSVDVIHTVGGTMLGSSRGGGRNTKAMVDNIEKLGLNMIFIIGGDGTQKGAHKIAREANERGYDLAVIGIPKTIDNDFSFIDRSFGFETAVDEATKAVKAAHQEAEAAFNGIGLVKLMGRNSGFITAYTAMATQETNFALIPEVKFDLEGSNGLFHHLEERLHARKHAVIIVAEGAGLEHLENVSYDASGNLQFNSTDSPDIGRFLARKIPEHFKSIAMDVTLKYINPSYIIRSAKAIPADALYCRRLGGNAVHAAMAGKTSMIISLINNYYVHLPMATVTSNVNTIDPEGSLWRDIVENLHMPLRMIN